MEFRALSFTTVTKSDADASFWNDNKERLQVGAVGNGYKDFLKLLVEV